MSPRAPASREVGREPAGPVTLTELAAVLLERRRIVLVCAFLGGVAGVLAARLPPARFAASASFTPEGAGDPSLGSLAGLAGQFGIQVPGNRASEGPEFYQELLTTRDIVADILVTRYEVEGQSVSLLDLAEIAGDSEAERVDRGLEWFRGDVLQSSVGPLTRIVTLTVTTEWPEVSQRIAANLLAGVQDFDLGTRQIQARAERAFLETRVAEAREELGSAEGVLQRFLQENVRFERSPELLLQYDRLQREVLTRQQVYTGLAEAFEQARIQEVRDTPVIVVLEAPIVPPRREPRGTVLKALLGLIVGTSLGATWAFVRRDVADPAREDTRALRAAWAETLADLRVLLFWRSA